MHYELHRECFMHSVGIRFHWLNSTSPESSSEWKAGDRVDFEQACLMTASNSVIILFLQLAAVFGRTNFSLPYLREPVSTSADLYPYYWFVFLKGNITHSVVYLPLFRLPVLRWQPICYHPDTGWPSFNRNKKTATQQPRSGLTWFIVPTVDELVARACVWHLQKTLLVKRLTCHLLRSTADSRSAISDHPRSCSYCLLVSAVVWLLTMLPVSGGNRPATGRADVVVGNWIVEHSGGFRMCCDIKQMKVSSGRLCSGRKEGRKRAWQLGALSCCVIALARWKSSKERSML